VLTRKNILVFNCGSSSLNCKVFSAAHTLDPKPIFSAKAHRVGVKGTQASFIDFKINGSSEKMTTDLPDHRTAAVKILRFLGSKGMSVDMIGHRFVHGGDFFQTSSMVNRDVLAKLHLCGPLAPIHNPISYSVIMASREELPGMGQYVVFDTAYHSTIPSHAYVYPVPDHIVEKYHYRKFGFHGLSYSYVAQAVPRFLGVSPDSLRMVACHLGTGGSSVSAIFGGRSLDNSMGWSPLTGLVMSTRSGDIDPMLTLYLTVANDLRPDDLLSLLTEKSGLLGIAEISSDLRDIIADVCPENRERTSLAFDMYVHRLKKYVGSYVAVLGGIDVLVFTDDIGATNWLVRSKTCEDMRWCGIELDETVNRQTVEPKATLVSSPDSKVKVVAMPTEEERIIATEGLRFLEEGGLS